MKKMRILITGAATGIGYDSTIYLAKRGHFIFATTYSIQQKNKMIKEVNELGLNRNINVEKLDINNSRDRDLIKNRRINILINNAGVGESGSMAEINVDLIEKDFQTNVFSTIRLTQNILPEMIKKQSGRIIFIGSLIGRLPVSFLGSYCMTKFSIRCCARALYKEMKLLNRNIKVSLIVPGFYSTRFNKNVINKKYDWMKRGSFFHKHIKKLKEDERRTLEILEMRNTSSIIEQIRKSVEDRKPKFKYKTQIFQHFMIFLLKLFDRD